MFRHKGNLQIKNINCHFFCHKALNNSCVWADGLLVFYEIFKFLEENVPAAILPPDYHRTQQFEEDLRFYKGCDWEKTYKPRESVVKYLKHLNHLKETNSLLLIAYVYHLYMGLLSGGQILAKKRQISSKFKWNQEQRDEADEYIEPGTALTSFKNKSIVQLKNTMRSVIDEYCKDFDDDTKQQLVVESQKVFELNNEIIKSVEGVTMQNLKLLGYIILIIFSIYVFIKMWSI